MASRTERRRSRQKLKALSKREVLALKKEQRAKQSRKDKLKSQREQIAYRLECLRALVETFENCTLTLYWAEQDRIAREDERYLRAKLKREWQSRGKPRRVF